MALVLQEQRAEWRYEQLATQIRHVADAVKMLSEKVTERDNSAKRASEKEQGFGLVTSKQMK